MLSCYISIVKRYYHRRGPAGNVEYLAYATLGAATEPADLETLVAAVPWA
jgi:hypothetical protein